MKVDKELFKQSIKYIEPNKLFKVLWWCVFNHKKVNHLNKRINDGMAFLTAFNESKNL